MMNQKRSSRIFAGAAALGMALFGFTGCKKIPPAGGEASVQPETSVTAPEERFAGLKVVCPKLSTAADAFLLTSPSGAVLIDTGEDTSAKTILRLLEENSVTTLDALILTHFDKDHIGGAAAVLDSVEVTALYRTPFKQDSQSYDALLRALERNPGTEVVTLTETVQLELGETIYTLYPPLAESYSKDEDNNSSIITTVTYSGGASTLLFAGDAEKARIKEYLSNQYDGTQYDFFKIPHHGRDLKPLNKMLKQFVPQHALITSSREEKEHDRLMTALMEEGTDVWLTREGEVTILCDENGMTVTQDETDSGRQMP